MKSMGRRSFFRNALTGACWFAPVRLRPCSPRREFGQYPFQAAAWMS